MSRPVAGPRPEGAAGDLEGGLAADLSRRGFLKGAGALAATPWLARQLVVERRPTGEGVQRQGPGEFDAELRINGAVHSVKLEPRYTLLHVLREQLDLTGTKEVCDRGACGGCTVLLDGAPVNACMLLAVDALGAEITTIEGLAAGGQLDPLQEAFCKHDAMQCGFCTPGLVVAGETLLKETPKPTLEQIRHVLAGNICRCGTYNKVFEAVQAAAGAAIAVGNVADNADKALENDAARVDAPLKVTGRAKYTADIKLPRMAYATIVSCPHGHARVQFADEEAARKVKGVLDVVLRKDEEYDYCGRPVGYVCAETRTAVDDALAALKLQWQVLPPTTDPLAVHAAAAGPFPPALESAPAGRGPVGSDETRKAVQAAFENAQRIVERTYTTQIQTHSTLEPHCAVADYRGESAELWCSSQGTGAIHGQAADIFGLDRSRVRAHCEHVGGGFGSKLNGVGYEGRTAAELSKKLGRPVKVVNDRKREHLDTGCRPGSLQYMKFAVDEQGLPVAGFVHVAGVNGPERRGGDASNPSRYNLGTVFKSFVDLGLTVGGARPMRAPGHPQGIFALDSFIDELAVAAQMDPLEYRRRIDTSDVRRKMYDVGAERIGWKTRPQPDGSGEGHLRRGIGVGVGDWPAFPADAQIRVDVFRDGTVKVLSGTQDIGTGTRTVLVDVLADQLGVDRALITSDCGNSDYPPGPTSGGSMTAHSIAPAIRDAGDAAKAKLKELTGQDYADSNSWRAACKKIPGESFTVIGSKNEKYWGEGDAEGVQFAEVEVDTETGVVRVLRVVALQACGQPVNRLTAENQIIGGVLQGVSYALFEEKLLDPTQGDMVNPNLEQYKILGPLDAPEVVPILWAEGQNLGVRQLGEPPTIPTAAAVANAVANALGVRVRSLPITPDKVLAALAEREGSV